MEFQYYFVFHQIFVYLHPVQRKRELSSAGSEHLPYKQGVTGSNPVAPTKPQKRGFFYALLIYYLQRESGSLLCGRDDGFEKATSRAQTGCFRIMTKTWGLGINFSQSKKKKSNISNTSKLGSECFYFSIKGFCRSIC